MAFSLQEQKALAIVPKVTGFLSAFFSILIVVCVARDPQKRSNPYHRFLLGIALVDISSSFWLALSTWPIPRDSGTLYAVGTTATCSLQGFFTQFGVASSFYNASLSIHYLLVIRYSWTQRQIQSIEPYLHAVPVLWGFGTAVLGVCLELFNNANLWCWIAPGRGDNANLYRWVLFYGPLWAMILLVTLNLVLVALHVRTVERRAAQYKFPRDVELSSTAPNSQNSQSKIPQHATQTEEPETVPKRPSVWNPRWYQRTSLTRSSLPQTETSKKSKAVAKQCYRYAGAFYFTWIAITITRVLQTARDKVYFPLLLISAATTPMQGLPNFIVYLAPRYQKAREENPEKGVWFLMKKSLEPE